MVLSVRTEQVLAVHVMCAKPISGLIVTTGTAENGVLKLVGPDPDIAEFILEYC